MYLKLTPQINKLKNITSATYTLSNLQSETSNSYRAHIISKVLNVLNKFNVTIKQIKVSCYNLILNKLIKYNY